MYGEVYKSHVQSRHRFRPMRLYYRASTYTHTYTSRSQIECIYLYTPLHRPEGGCPTPFRCGVGSTNIHYGGIDRHGARWRDPAMSIRLQVLFLIVFYRLCGMWRVVPCPSPCFTEGGLCISRVVVGCLRVWALRAV